MTGAERTTSCRIAAVALVLAACEGRGVELASSADAAKTDRPPKIAAVSYPRQPVRAGDAVPLSVKASDPDGDPITIAWSADCAGTFSAPDQPQTRWTPFVTGTCTLTVEARARTLSDTARFAVVVQPGTGGTVVVDAAFVPWPAVTEVALAESTISRTAADATVRLSTDAPATLDGRFAFDLFAAPGALRVAVHDDCGGAVEVDPAWAGADGVGGGSFRWTRPAGALLCMVTVEVDHEGLVDGFPVAVVSRQ